MFKALFFFIISYRLRTLKILFFYYFYDKKMIWTNFCKDLAMSLIGTKSKMHFIHGSITKKIRVKMSEKVPLEGGGVKGAPTRVQGWEYWSEIYREGYNRVVFTISKNIYMVPSISPYRQSFNVLLWLFVEKVVLRPKNIYWKLRDNS